MPRRQQAQPSEEQTSYLKLLAYLSMFVLACVFAFINYQTVHDTFDKEMSVLYKSSFACAQDYVKDCEGASRAGGDDLIECQKKAECMYEPHFQADNYIETWVSCLHAMANGVNLVALIIVALIWNNVLK